MLLHTMNTELPPLLELVSVKKRMCHIRDDVKAFTLQQYLGKTLEPRDMKALYMFLIVFQKSKLTGPYKYSDLRSKSAITERLRILIKEIQEKTGQPRWATTNNNHLKASVEKLVKNQFIVEAKPGQIKATYPEKADWPEPRRGAKALHFMPGWASLHAAKLDPEAPPVASVFTLDTLLQFLAKIVLYEHPGVHRELVGELPPKKPKSKVEEQAEFIGALMELAILPETLRDELTMIDFDFFNNHPEYFAHIPLVQDVLEGQTTKVAFDTLASIGIKLEPLIEKFGEVREKEGDKEAMKRYKHDLLKQTKDAARKGKFNEKQQALLKELNKKLMGDDT